MGLGVGEPGTKAEGEQTGGGGYLPYVPGIPRAQNRGTGARGHSLPLTPELERRWVGPRRWGDVLES